jgi:predicted nucleotidyltransferase
MRLTQDQAEAVRQRVRKHLGPGARIWLFGSRADDTRRGGDVDLYVEPVDRASLLACLRCRSELAEALDLKVDLIVQEPGRELPIHRIARQSGVAL